MTTIDYPRMQRRHRVHKAALTRAINSGEPRKVEDACRAAVREWDEIGAWPDDWSRWQRALDDAYPFPEFTTLESLRVG